MVDLLRDFDESKVQQTMTTTTKAAQALGLTPRAIRYWIQAGMLGAARKGHYYLIDFDEAEAIARQSGHKFPPDFWVRKAKALGALPAEVAEIADYDRIQDCWPEASDQPLIPVKSDRDMAIESLLRDTVTDVLDLCSQYDDWSDLPESAAGIPGLVDAFDAHLETARIAREQDDIMRKTQAKIDMLRAEIKVLQDTVDNLQSSRLADLSPRR